MKTMTLVTHGLLSTAVVICLVYTVGAIFEPEVRVQSCDKGELTVTIHNATDGGIVYVQGARSACLHFTSAVPDKYTFDIIGCKLDWNGQFKLVIQRRALYQTSEDKVITVMCIVETEDIVVNGKLNVRDEDDEGEEFVEKPMASMRLFRETEDVTGTDVTLDDMLNLQIELDDEYKDEVDISAKECHAAAIPIIKSSCAVDDELFPNFAHIVKGELSASFAAFRPTILNGGSFTLVLSCTLAICRGHCHKNACGGADYRMKRAAITENVTQTLEVATVVRIVADESLLNRENAVCLSPQVVVSFASITLISAAAIAALFVRYLRKLIAGRKVESLLSRQNSKDSVTSTVSQNSTVSENVADTSPVKDRAKKRVNFEIAIDDHENGTRKMEDGQRQTEKTAHSMVSNKLAVSKGDNSQKSCGCENGRKGILSVGNGNREGARSPAKTGRFLAVASGLKARRLSTVIMEQNVSKAMDKLRKVNPH